MTLPQGDDNASEVEPASEDLFGDAIDPDAPGCWQCLQQHLSDESIHPAPVDPNGTIQPIGCAAPTFQASGFDVGMVALQGVRSAVSLLTTPPADQTLPAVAVLRLRDQSGRLTLPEWTGYPLDQHPQCPNHR